MKVLIVHDFGQRIGGAEQMSITLRDGLRARGHDCRWFTSRALAGEGPIESDHTAWGTTGPLRRITQVANPAAANALRRVVRDFQPDVVHVRMFLNQLSPLILPVLRNVPTLLHVVIYELICPIALKRLRDGRDCPHRPGSVCWREGCVSLGGLARVAVQRRLLHAGFDVFDRVIANSDYVRRRLEHEGWRVDDVVWNGVPQPVEVGHPLADEPTAVFAGRLTEEKGIFWLLDAFARISRDLPAARLLIAGDGPEGPRIANHIQSAGLADRVRLLGRLSPAQMQRAFAGAWVQVAPSLWEEPFGIVAAEAMMRQTAVIATRSGGLTEQVIDGETGLVVPPGDTAALAAALARILSDRQLAQRMGQAGRRRAVAEFSVDRFIDRFETIYLDMIRTAPVAGASAPPTVVNC